MNSPPATTTPSFSPAAHTMKKVKLSGLLLPNRYTDCSADHLVQLIVAMFSQLISHNDSIPITLADTTRFHSRCPPAIGIRDYVDRINKYVVVEKSVLLMTLVYVDRMCALNKNFHISSLTAHRFLIACITTSCKCVSDVYSTNSFFAKVGGISTQELNELELEFCKLLQWRLMCSSALLQDYYVHLIMNNQNYNVYREMDVPGSLSGPQDRRPISPKSPINPYLDDDPFAEHPPMMLPM